MRNLLLTTLIAALTTFPVRADAADSDHKFTDLAAMSTYKNGALEILLWDDSKTWLNGIRQNDDDDNLILKPGDVVESFVGGDFDRVIRYRLDRLTPQRACFTRWIYSSIKSRTDEGLREYRRGSLQFTDKFEIDPNDVSLLEYGPRHLELSWQKPSRGK